MVPVRIEKYKLLTMKSVLLILFMCVFSMSYAQQHATQNTYCQMTEDDILRQQSFDIDDPISEQASHLIRDIYEGLNLIYQTPAGDPLLASLIDSLNETVLEAENLPLNITMFQQDLDHVANL